MQIGTQVVITDDHDPYLPAGQYTGTTGTLISDWGPGPADEVRYAVRFGDGTGRRGDRTNGWVCARSVRPA